MAQALYYRKKDMTMAQFFERLGEFIPISIIDLESRRIQSNTKFGAVSVYVKNDEDISLLEDGPRGRELIIQLVHGEESGWQKITVANHTKDDATLERFYYVMDLMASKFGGILWDDITFPGEEPHPNDIFLENLPPEILAFDPDDPIRAYLLYKSTPEEREEAQRIYEEIRRKLQEAEQSAKRKQVQDSVHPKPKRRRAFRHR